MLDSSHEDTLLDRDAALDHVQGDEEFLREIYQIFLEEIPTRLENFHRALEENDIQAIVGLAHSLKGVSLTIGALSCHKAALNLEMAAREGDEAKVREIFPTLNTILEQLEEQLSNIE